MAVNRSKDRQLFTTFYKLNDTTAHVCQCKKSNDGTFYYISRYGNSDGSIYSTPICRQVEITKDDFKDERNNHIKVDKDRNGDLIYIVLGEFFEKLKVKAKRREVYASDCSDNSSKLKKNQYINLDNYCEICKGSDKFK